MPTEREIGEALDTQLRAAFPPDDLGYPQTPLTRRAAGIMEAAATLLLMEGYPLIEGYNYQEAGYMGVTCNVKYPAEDGGIWVSSQGLDMQLSDTACAQAVYARWKADFNGELQLKKSED